jgi:hypothetical protein
MLRFSWKSVEWPNSVFLITPGARRSGEHRRS